MALPTGLGKTLIAAVVMYNYFRWFPDGNLLLVVLFNKLHTFHVLFIIWLDCFSFFGRILTERGKISRLRVRVCFLYDTAKRAWISILKVASLL